MGALFRFSPVGFISGPIFRLVCVVGSIKIYSDLKKFEEYFVGIRVYGCLYQFVTILVPILWLTCVFD